MTAEVLIMNKQAVALAADSASTVKQPSSQRYFKGANKIYQISNNYPVGLMIYNLLELHGVPWEVLIKDFRASIKDRNYNSVQEYAEAFFLHIKNHEFFSSKENLLQSSLIRIAHQLPDLIKYVASSDAYKFICEGSAPKEEHIPKNIVLTMDKLKEQMVKDYGINEHDERILKFTRDHSSEVISMSGIPDVYRDHSKNIIDFVAVWEHSAMKNDQYFTGTGLVFTGFGEKEYFPTYHEYNYLGYVVDSLKFKHLNKGNVSADNGALMAQFAIRGARDTFILGVSATQFEEAVEIFEGISVKMLNELGVTIDESVLQKLQHAKSQFIGDWAAKIKMEHSDPTREVIQAMSIEEMSIFAETLINMESLKEKISKPTESVGGPVDVAVISKFDGFIWIKRKHYFDKDLNPRFTKIL